MNTKTDNSQAAVGIGSTALLGSVCFSVGDIITVPIKNRWGIDCAATIEAVHADTVGATVWNMGGPGADQLVTGIPYSVCMPNAKEEPRGPNTGE